MRFWFGVLALLPSVFWCVLFLGRFSREKSLVEGKMETSLRYTCNSKSLKIHAKEKLHVNSKTHLQVGETLRLLF